jgi:anaerobic magnesium-protoporphyrin IX monomethyl ester cyclase
MQCCASWFARPQAEDLRVKILFVFTRDAALRHGMRWYARMGRRMWFHEWRNFLRRDRRVKDGPTLRAFWGDPQDQQEVPLRIVRHEAASALSLKVIEIS